MKNTEMPAGYVTAKSVLLSYGCAENAVGVAAAQYARKLRAVKIGKHLCFNEAELRAAIEESRAQLKPDAVLAATVSKENNVSRRAVEKLAQMRKLWRGYHMGRLYVSRSDFSDYRAVQQETAQQEKLDAPPGIPDGYLSISEASARLGLTSPFPLGGFLRYNKDIPRIVKEQRTYVDFAALVEAYKDSNRKGHASSRAGIVLKAPTTPISTAPEPVPAVISAPPPSTPAPATPLSVMLSIVVAELRAAGFSGTANLDMKTGKLTATRTVIVEVEL